MRFVNRHPLFHTYLLWVVLNDPVSDENRRETPMGQPKGRTRKHPDRKSMRTIY
jgi:hypothetical protein